MKESEERIHEGSQAIAVGNNNPCREMRRALSVDENQTHFSFLPRNCLPSMGISHSVSIFGDALIFPRFNRRRRDNTTSDETNFVVKFPFQPRLLKDKYTPVKDILNCSTNIVSDRTLF